MGEVGNGAEGQRRGVGVKEPTAASGGNREADE